MAMDECIYREAAIEALCCDCSATGDCRPGERCVDYMRIKSIPAADVRPVVRGKWMRGDMPTYGGYKCSVCGGNTTHYKANFCPNCGADMRGGS